MRINLHGDSLPDEFVNLGVRTRVTMTVTFEVESVSEDMGFNVSGDVRSFDVTNTRGSGGLNPAVESAKATLRSMSVHG